MNRARPRRSGASPRSTRSPRRRRGSRRRQLRASDGASVDHAYANTLRNVEELLLSWFDEHGRDLPWRRTRDPYAILVSEIMAQQTQVRRVLEYYPRFLARYPTVADLAAASVPAVRESWDGLGYYRRAANLRRAAQHVAECHGG